VQLSISYLLLNLSISGVICKRRRGTQPRVGIGGGVHLAGQVVRDGHLFLEASDAEDARLAGVGGAHVLVVDRGNSTAQEGAGETTDGGGRLELLEHRAKYSAGQNSWIRVGAENILQAISCCTFLNDFFSWGICSIFIQEEDIIFK